MIIVNHVLGSIHIYTLLAYSIPKVVLAKLESHFFFFLGESYEGKPRKEVEVMENYDPSRI